MLVRLFAPQRPKLKSIFEKKTSSWGNYVNFRRVKQCVASFNCILFFAHCMGIKCVHTAQWHPLILYYFHFALEFPHFMGHDTAIIAVIVKT